MSFVSSSRARAYLTSSGASTAGKPNPAVVNTITGTVHFSTSVDYTTDAACRQLSGPSCCGSPVLVIKHSLATSGPILLHVTTGDTQTALTFKVTARAAQCVAADAMTIVGNALLKNSATVQAVVGNLP